MEFEPSALEWLLSIDGVTFIIAVAGMVMSVYNFIVDIIQKTTRLKVEFAHIFRFEDSKRCIEIINVKIYNKSHIPVVISRLSVCDQCGQHSFGSYRKTLFETEAERKGKIVSRNNWMSDLLPVKIEGNGCANLLLLADEEQRTINTEARNNVIIHTAKRNIRKSVKITRFSDSKLLSQCREPSR